MPLHIVEVVKVEAEGEEVELGCLARLALPAQYLEQAAELHVVIRPDSVHVCSNGIARGV